MSNTLIIFENVPESTDLFLIPNEIIDTELQGLITDSTGKFINSDDDIDALDKLFERLYGDEDGNDGDLKQYHQGDETFSIKDTHITAVYIMGFFC